MIFSWRRILVSHLGALVDLVYPPVCLGCGQRAENPRTQFCNVCWCRLRPLDHPQVPHLWAAFVADRLFLQVLACGKYRGARSSLVRLVSLAVARMAPQLPPGTLLPVPLTAERRRVRGFNQSEIFASSLAAATGLRLETRWLGRRIARQQSAGLPRAERMAAVTGAFRATPEFPGEAAGPLLLVDDVYTTGSTLGECARVLTERGGQVVGFVCLARAFEKNDRISASREKASELPWAFRAGHEEK